MDFGIILSFIFGSIIIGRHTALCEKESLYDTKSATSDLLWTAYPATNGWEEVSGLDLKGRIIRSYQVCKHDDPDTSNWIRTPYIKSRGAQRAYIDVEFSMVKCDELNKSCRETFNLYYYEDVEDSASSTYPPWRENPYIKIDTIAAGERFSAVSSDKAGGVNLKTWTLGPLTSNGFYIAAHDKGACMSLMSLKVYFYYCPPLIESLAVFPKTVAGVEVTSLVKVNGQCVANSNSTTSQAPRYYCNSNGEWKVRTGSCHCQPGYQANQQMTACNVCEQGRYKNNHGNGACAQCPLHSRSEEYSGDVASSYCACVPGYYRALREDVHSPCTRPPGKPSSVDFKVNSTSVVITWSRPTVTGNRPDLYYNVSCFKCAPVCKPCDGNELFYPARHQDIKGRSLRVKNLTPHTTYKFKVFAMNGVSAVSNSAPQHALVFAITDEAEPSLVQKVTLTSSGERNASVSWLKPQFPNGEITKYQILCTEVLMVNDEIVNNEKAPFSLETSNETVVINGLEPGNLYSVRVRAATAAGFGPYSYPITMRTKQEDITRSEQQGTSSASLMAGIGVAVLLLVVVLGVIVYLHRSRNKKIEREQLSEESTIDEKEPLESHSREESLIVYLPESYGTTKTYVEYPDPRAAVKELSCEIDPSLLYIEHTIGQGEFGEVCRGSLNQENGNEGHLVAVKRLKSGANAADQLNFLKEASTMAQFFHPNVVQLKGVVTKSRPQMIVTEYMENGSLDAFLKSNINNLNLLQLLKMLRGIASGMRYLSQMKYVHRDLAARNILVGSDLACKVSDFGLSRTLENDPHAIYTTQGGKIAIRWTAPECIRCRQFTSSSDVWSFGIVMWEVMSYGEKPYWDMTNQEVLESIDEGYRLPAPYECPMALHHLMVECWCSDPHKRPTMDQICERLDVYIEQPGELAEINMKEPTTPTTPLTTNPLDELVEES